MTKKEMMAFIDKVVKECGQVPLGTGFGKFRNLMWDDERGTVLQTMTYPNGYIIIKAIYDDLKKDFE